MITAQITVDDYIAAHRLHHQRRTRILYAISATVAIGGVLLWVVGWKYWVIVLFTGLGALLGLVLATLFVHSRLAERAFVPYVIASQTIPIVALALSAVEGFRAIIWEPFSHWVQRIQSGGVQRPTRSQIKTAWRETRQAFPWIVPGLS